MDFIAAYHQYALQAAAAYKRHTGEQGDTQECAEFLLALKNNDSPSETPDFPPETEGRYIDPSRGPVAFVLPQPRLVVPPALIPSRAMGRVEPKFDPRPPALMDERGAIEAFWETLLGGSPLVKMQDRELVPDPLFVSMAQMRPCSLSHADRVGCYKGRPLGFTGMCCKHCGGQPGFGKYFPETVRSLAQTTTSQTILKHVGSKCRFCPPHIRQAVLELQRQQVIKESANAGRPRYGSRKVFFQRIWQRLHGENALDPLAAQEEANKGSEATPDYTETEGEDGHSTDDTATSDEAAPKRKNRFGLLPTKKNLMKRKMMGVPEATFGGFEPPSKRSKFDQWAAY